jgi:hypothetical protein
MRISTTLKRTEIARPDIVKWITLNTVHYSAGIRESGIIVVGRNIPLVAISRSLCKGNSALNTSQRNENTAASLDDGNSWTIGESTEQVVPRPVLVLNSPAVHNSKDTRGDLRGDLIELHEKLTGTEAWYLTVARGLQSCTVADEGAVRGHLALVPLGVQEHRRLIVRVSTWIRQMQPRVSAPGDLLARVSWFQKRSIIIVEQKGNILDRA